MTSPPRQSAERRNGWFSWIVPVVAAGVILAEIAGAYLLFSSAAVPETVVYGGTVATAVVVVGPSLYVASRRVFASDPPPEPGDKSGLTRASEVIVSVVVLTGVAVLLGSLGGLGLTLLAKLGGPDPKTADGDLLRNRLLSWAERNREFMRTNGSGRLPLKP